MIENNLKFVIEKIKKSCEKVGRDSSSVQLVAVSKRQNTSKIEAVIQAGQRVFGENFINSLSERQAQFPSEKWHLIGPIQSKKVSKLSTHCELIHSIDRLKIAELVHKKFESENHVQDVLLQINIAGEESKSGFTKTEIFDFFGLMREMEGLKIRGLMTIPPQSENPEGSRIYFRELQQLFVSLRDKFDLGPEFSELSMGTTQDYCVAIEEGATLVRVGTAIFGEREG